MKIGFIGLGIMGSRMASHLIDDGYELIVSNRSKEKADILIGQGAVFLPTPAEVAEASDIIITMLSTPEAVQHVAASEGGILTIQGNNKLWMDCSTVNPSFARGMCEISNDSGFRYIDAPVAGSKPQAENKELVFFLGGDDQDVNEVEKLFTVMGARYIHVGGVGMGSSFKMLVNNMLAQSMLMFAETLNLGENMGLDRDFLLNTLPNLPVSAPFTKFKAEMIRSGDYTEQFPLELMQKDLHLVATTAYELGIPMFQSNTTKEVYQAANNSGLGREDLAAVYKFLSKNGS